MVLGDTSKSLMCCEVAIQQSLGCFYRVLPLTERCSQREGLLGFYDSLRIREITRYSQDGLFYWASRFVNENSAI